MPFLKKRYRNRSGGKQSRVQKGRFKNNRNRKVLSVPRPTLRYKVARVPYQQRVRLCTTATYAVDTLAATYDDAFIIQANSLYKPFALTNAQPAWFDQYARLYNRYAVTSTKVIVKTIPIPSTQEAHQNTPRITIIPTHSATLTMAKGQTRAYPAEMGGVKESIIKNDNTSTVITNFSTTNKQLGMRHSLYDLQTSVGASPSRIWYFHILIEDPMGSEPVYCKFEVFLYQYVTFFDRNNDLEDA